MQFGEGSYRIGEIAARTGLTPDALRYYERLGLLPRSRRTEGGFRIYTPEALERVRFIKQAQTVGLTLDEIGELTRCLDGDEGENVTCVTALILARLMEVNARLGELRRFRRTLKRYVQKPAASSRGREHAGAAR